MATETLQQLRTLLHNGQVGTEIGVEHMVEAQLTQCGDHPAGDQRARLQAELLTQGGTHRRSGLHHYGLLRVTQGTNDLIGVVHLGECTGGADRDALPAVGAGRILQIHLEGRSHHRHEAAVHRREGTHRLHLVAHHLTAAAHDALIHIADDGGGGVFAVV